MFRKHVIIRNAQTPHKSRLVAAALQRALARSLTSQPHPSPLPLTRGRDLSHQAAEMQLRVAVPPLYKSTAFLFFLGLSSPLDEKKKKRKKA